MNMKSRIISATLVFILPGCAEYSLVGARGAKWPWPADKSQICSTSCNGSDALRAFTQASDYCRQVQNYYEAGGQRANGTKLGVGVIGTLAGAVIAPIAKGTAIKAWSGLSGSTNALQANLDETFSSSIAANRRAAVAQAAVQGENRFFTSGLSDDEKVAAAISMARNCSSSSAIADQKSLHALSEEPIPIPAK